MALGPLLQSVDWNKNMRDFAAQSEQMTILQNGCRLISTWTHELLFYDRSNPANPFLQEMKASLFTVPICIGLGLNKPAAASLRTAVESALYFSYFSTHPSELTTLTRNKKYYTDKSKIIDYHNSHTARFQPMQETLGLLSMLNEWYGQISAIIHGQIPGIWSEKSVASTKYDKKKAKHVVDEFNTAIKIINYWLIATVTLHTWEGLSSPARQQFLKGLKPSQKVKLGLTVV